jgi:DNA replication protein DnaC
MYLNDLMREQLPPNAMEKLPLLERLDFIESGQNIVLAGNPGTGKTHIAIGLGLKACLQGYKVLFTTIHKLLTQIRESHSQRTLKVMEARFEKYDLVICDEFGYVSFDKEGSELLFNHLSLRAGRKSTIITTNLGFERWEEIFGDPVLTAALVDRLTHKAHLINMNGESYRLKETKQMMNK